MGKQIKQRKKTYTYKGWKEDSVDGWFLARLFTSGALSLAAMSSLIKERFPWLKVYKTQSFAAGLHRLKAKLGLNMRNNNDVDVEEDGAYTLGSKDTGCDDEEMDDKEEEVEEVISPDTIHRNYFINNDVTVVDPPLPLVSINSSSKSPAFPSVARMPSSVQSIIQCPSVRYCWNPPHLKTIYKDVITLNHQFVAFLLPSAVGYHDNHDVHLSMSVYGSVVYYLILEIEWPDTFEKDDADKFLSFLKKKTLMRKTSKWLDKKNMAAEKAHAKKEIKLSWVMLEMAVKQEMIRMRNAKGTTTLWSQTWVKMDFPVERLIEDCWELIGDPDTNVRMLVVDLEQPTENKESKPASFERKVEMIRVDIN